MLTAMVATEIIVTGMKATKMKVTERRNLEITIHSFFLRIGPSTNFFLG